MDRRELANDVLEALRALTDARAARIWTTLPAIVVSFDADAWTIVAQPTIKDRVRQKDGTWKSVQLPPIPDVPVEFTGGGGVTGVFPIGSGDECMLFFSARCIDSWWSQGGVQDPPEYRMHNLSDAFALVGLRSQPRIFSLPAGVAGLVTDDGETFITLNPTSKAVAAQASGGINLNGMTIDSSGNIATNGNILSQGTVTGKTDVVSGSTSISGLTHTHTSASPGSPTSPPLPG